MDTHTRTGTWARTYVRMRAQPHTHLHTRVSADVPANLRREARPALLLAAEDGGGEDGEGGGDGDVEAEHVVVVGDEVPLLGVPAPGAGFGDERWKTEEERWGPDHRPGERETRPTLPFYCAF